MRPTIEPFGFFWRPGNEGISCGGDYAMGQFVRNNRCLEIHFRHSLGLVSYALGNRSMTHDAYMRVVVGQSEHNQYPGFSDDPLDGFRHLAHDLSHFCAAFLEGSDADFLRILQLASALPNARRLP